MKYLHGECFYIDVKGWALIYELGNIHVDDGNGVAFTLRREVATLDL